MTGLRTTLLMVAWLPSVVLAQPTLHEQQREARQQQEALRGRIQQLQQALQTTEGSRDEASSALAKVETQISHTDRELNDLQQRRQKVAAHLQTLQQKIAQQTQLRDQRQAELAEQIRAMHASGLSPWAALLSGNDPQKIQRELTYLAYVSQAQAKAVQALRQVLVELATLKADTEATQAELTQLAQKTEQQRDKLVAQKNERNQVLAKLEGTLREQRGQAKSMEQNSSRLGQLVSRLDKEIAYQAELRRQAEARRRVEEARRQVEEAKRQAEAAKRQQEEAQRLAQARAAEHAAQREAEQAAARQRAVAAREAAEAAQAQTEQARQAEQAARSKVTEPSISKSTASNAEPSTERVKLSPVVPTEANASKSAAPDTTSGLTAMDITPIKLKPSEEPIASLTPAPGTKKTPVKPKAAPIQPAREARSAPAEPVAQVPAGGFTGLKRGGLATPLAGERQGKFGAQRPEGGVWRGIVIRSNEGATVHSVGPGQVVFADWLKGFGNLIIVDHGKGLMSVYGYNQSLLKGVGDVVKASEAIAKVGATGGQVEPGLYFELRENGQPVNPALWLKGS